MSSNKQNYNQNQANNQGQSSSNSGSKNKPVSDYSITKPYGGMKGILIFLSSNFREIFQKTEHLEEKLHQ
jgi:hypothetical protein